MLIDNRDYDKILKRHEYFCNNEILDRPCISIKAPKDPHKPYIPHPPTSQEDLKKWHTDGEWLLKRKLEEMEKTYFAGDALPIIFPYFGTGGHAKYITSEKNIEYDDRTIWIHPSIEDLSTYNYDFDPQNNDVFKQECDTLSYLVSQANGRYFVGMPDNCGSYDALSQLRGGEDFLVDMLTDEDELKIAGRKLVDILIKSGDIMFDIIKENCLGGSVQGWMNTISKGRMMQLQCDLSVMISKELFDSYIKEELELTSKWLDHAIYHFDGIEQIRHLDTLLSIDEIKTIQWTQVSGQPSATNFIPELKRIQAAGKGLIIPASANQAIDILENISPKGLNLLVDINSPEEADSFLKAVSKYR